MAGELARTQQPGDGLWPLIVTSHSSSLGYPQGRLLVALSPLVCIDAHPPLRALLVQSGQRGSRGPRTCESWVLSPHWPFSPERRDIWEQGGWLACLAPGAPEGQGLSLTAVQPSPHDGLAAPAPLRGRRCCLSEVWESPDFLRMGMCRAHHLGVCTGP